MMQFDDEMIVLMYGVLLDQIHMMVSTRCPALAILEAFGRILSAGRVVSP